MEYDGILSQMSLTTCKIYKSTLMNLINHNALERDKNVENALRIIDEEIELRESR